MIFCFGGDEATLPGEEYVKFIFLIDFDLECTEAEGDLLITSTFLVIGAGLITGATLMTYF